MQIKKLTLRNFRNYEEETFSFSDGINVLFGKNAQGKTNCAEAVFYLCTGSSLRIRHDKQLIRTGTDGAHIFAEAQNRYGSVTIGADITEGGRDIRVNGNKIAKNADLLGNVNSVFFSPGELRLIQDGPDERRRFLNLSISQLSKNYYTALLRYNHILEQRNNLLKNRDTSLVLETLPVWDEQLSLYAARIILARKEYCRSLSPLAEEMHAFLTEQRESLAVGTDSPYEGDEGEIAAAVFKDMQSSYERDVYRGYTGVGPHRDDLKISIDGLDAKGYASQGQARTAALALKLAELEIFRERAGEYPVLILDDVMSELDLPRRKKLVERLSGVQTVLTCTHAERVLYGKECNKIRVSGGRIVR